MENIKSYENIYTQEGTIVHSWINNKFCFVILTIGWDIPQVMMIVDIYVNESRPRQLFRKSQIFDSIVRHLRWG